MTAAQSQAVMRRYVDAVSAGDWATASGFFADDIVLRIPGRSPLAGERRGRDAAMAYRIADDQIVEIWIFEGDQYAVDELLGD
jgi:ketosteroid isomerase-like protein